MNKTGAKIAVDNSFGPAVERAVKAFQKKYGLAQDGSYGPATQAKMKQVLADKAKPKATKEYVRLPKSAATWKTYKLNVQPVSKNSDWSLTPARYGGLEYEVLGKPQANVVTIKTSKGNRNIFAAPSTGAKFVKR